MKNKINLKKGILLVKTNVLHVNGITLYNFFTNLCTNTVQLICETFQLVWLFYACVHTCSERLSPIRYFYQLIFKKFFFYILWKDYHLTLILDKNLISSTNSMHVFLFCIAVTFITNEKHSKKMLLTIVFIQPHFSNIYGSLKICISYLIEVR